ncbi:MAG: sulfatase-like hydrolase/transferase [Planctomycetaceae bacterium]
MIKYSALVASIATALSALAPAADLPAKPNIVLIIADDLGYGETGMQGNTQIATPGIDALAASGVRCTCGYVTSSLCSPSRAGIMTGKFQSRFGYDVNPIGEANQSEAAGLPESEITFIARLQEAGYRTGLVGKWHLGASEAKRPLKRGFDSFFGFLHEGHYYVSGPPYRDVQTMVRTRSLPTGEFKQDGQVFRGNYTGGDEPNYDAGNPLLRGDTPVEESGYLTDLITRNAVSFIEEADDKPFALVVAYNAVHSPMQAQLSDLANVHGVDDPQRKIFLAMLLALDRGVGEIRGAIEKRDALNNTLIVFLSDNGGPTRELTSSNAPLRGGKGDLYEGGIRVPMVWSMPGTIPAGGVEERPVLSIDVAATSLALASVELDQSIDGVNVIPYLTKENRDVLHPRIYWRMGRGKTALRQDDWKIVRPGPGKPFELYHLAVDEAEADDLAAKEPVRMRELVHAWMSMDSEMPEPIQVSRPARQANR